MNKKVKSAISLLLGGVCALSMAACGGSDDKKNNQQENLGVVNNSYKVGGKVVLGSTTEASGDFRFPAAYSGSSVGAADQDITGLTQGYDTMSVNQAGSYVWNQTTVKSHSETANDDSTYTVEIEINPGLLMSDGTEVKAINYLAYALVYSTPVSVAAGASGMAGQAFVGFDEFSSYDGTAETPEKFTGLKLLDEYKFSMTISSNYYPYYFAYTYGAVSPYDLALVAGDASYIHADETGAWLDNAFYAKEGDTYKSVAHFEKARYDVSEYPFTGAYTISKWDASTKETTLALNPNFAGNFEGQKPHISTVVYKYVVSETQVAQLKAGQVDVIEGITGGDETNQALAVVTENPNGFKENHYDRAGYGKIQFDCDFGPTMFKEVRQAITYSMDRNDFAQTFTGGYGALVNGPYSTNFEAYTNNMDVLEEKLNAYSFSEANAKKALVDGGWIYNSKGGAFEEGKSGVDSVRYKKLTAAEATDVNKAFKSVRNEDGIEYKTVEVNGEYYMPCVVNWFSSENNDVSDLLVTKLQKSTALKNIGMVIRQEVGSFTKLLGEIYREASYGYGGTPTYGMFNLATGWSTEIYDYSYNWSLDEMYFPYSANKLFDEYDKAYPYYDADGNHEAKTYEEAMAASDGKLGMDYISMAMVYDATTQAEYEKWFVAYMVRWNELMPDIPLYSNIYYDVYNSDILNYKSSPFFGASDAILYCASAAAQTADAESAS